MVSMSDLQCGSPGLFPGREGSGFAVQLIWRVLIKE